MTEQPRKTDTQQQHSAAKAPTMACAILGAIVFNILNYATEGMVPGGAIGGAIGGVLGGFVGWAIYSLRKK